MPAPTRIVSFVIATVLAGVATGKDVCTTEKFGDTEKSHTNYRLQLGTDYAPKKSWFVEIPQLPYCPLSGTMLTVCDPSGQQPVVVHLDFLNAVVVRQTENLVPPAYYKLVVFCKYNE
ncbi:hypothetical protein evm_012445 [Chilo suppressalis]|nr:hypothetical protein evm_012445 [Chilo suppressalis]